MTRIRLLYTMPLTALLMLVLSACQPASAADAALPAPALDAPKTSAHGEQVAVLAGGCFWGVEAVFEHVKGVHRVVAGYSGGSADTAHYDEVGEGDTGHAESVEVHFDPARISYGQLLQVFFSVALDPTQRNRQGPDVGSQYRSVIFYANPGQQRIASAYLAQLTAAKSFPRADRDPAGAAAGVLSGRGLPPALFPACIRTTRTSSTTTPRRSRI